MGCASGCWRSLCSDCCPCQVLQGAQYLLGDLMGYQGLLMLKLLVKAVTLKNCFLVMVSWLCFARRCLKILVCAVT